jgi:NAD(P)-dependent dehydrogenase (short-subunit alcohol dehydrogenase family)
LDVFLGRYRGDAGAQKRVYTAVVDAGDEEAVRGAFADAKGRCGMPEILINAVGGNRSKVPFVDIDIEEFREILDLNLAAGLVIPTKLFCREWIAAKVEGSIINITSMTSYNPLSGVWAYDAAKSATLNLTMAAANEFAKHGIRVNAIAPGFFIGKQNKALLIDEATGDYTQRGKDIITRTPFKRLGEVGELAGVTVFLASSQASGFVTGVSIPVDGGYLVHNI